MKVRGRFWLGLWLLVFLAVAVAIVARQRAALATAGELNRLRRERGALEATKVELEGRIRDAISRPILVPKAETRLRLHLPADSEVKQLALPGAPADTGR